MISSGALPKVALRSPPIASPVRVASCSVDSTISRAAGTIASAAEKKITGGGTCAYSSAIDTGMNTNSQLSDGLNDRPTSGAGCTCVVLIQPVHDGEEKSGRPPAHQDAGERLDGAVEPPFLRQHDVAVAGRRVGDGAEVQGRRQIGDRAVPHVHRRPYGNLHQVQQDDPDRDADEQRSAAPQPRSEQTSTGHKLKCP